MSAIFMHFLNLSIEDKNSLFISLQMRALFVTFERGILNFPPTKEQAEWCVILTGLSFEM